MEVMSMEQMAKSNSNFASVLYDQFREMANVLSGLLLGLCDRYAAIGDYDSEAVLLEEWSSLDHAARTCPVDDISMQVSLMEEWRFVIAGLRAL